MDNNENNTIIDNIIDCNKQAYSILYALNEDKPFVSECTNEIKERNLLRGCLKIQINSTIG